MEPHKKEFKMINKVIHPHNIDFLGSLNLATGDKVQLKTGKGNNMVTHINEIVTGGGTCVLSVGVRIIKTIT